MPTIQTATLAHEIAEAVRTRLELSRPLSDLDVFQIAVVSACNTPSEIVEFVFDRTLAKELATQASRAAITRNEWTALFAGISGTTATADAAVVHLGDQKRRIEGALAYTLQERDQAAKWSQPLAQLLVYVALHASEEVEEKVADVLGEVVRTDARRLEDLRTTMEAEGVDVIVLAEAVRAVGMSVGLG